MTTPFQSPDEVDSYCPDCGLRKIDHDDGRGCDTCDNRRRANAECVRQ